MIQNTGLLPHLSTRKNIDLAGKVSGHPVSATKITELLSLIGLEEDVLHKYPHELSGGQQQRIGIARSLATDPDLILMDEPFSALDNLTRGQLQDDFSSLKHLTNKTILMVTHDIQEAFKLGDRIVLLNDGEIQQVGPPLELLEHPANAFVSDFLAKDRFILRLESFIHQEKTALEIMSGSNHTKEEKVALIKKFLEKE